MLAAARSTFAAYIARGALRIVEGIVDVETVNTLLEGIGLPPGGRFPVAGYRPEHVARLACAAVAGAGGLHRI